MKKGMRLALLILVVLTALSVFCACGPSEKNANNNNADIVITFLQTAAAKLPPLTSTKTGNLPCLPILRKAAMPLRAGIWIPQPQQRLPPTIFPLP